MGRDLIKKAGAEAGAGGHDLSTAPAGSHGTPDQEVEITLRLLRSLLAEQRPDLLDLPLEPFASGWDNALFRLGEDLTLRLPRRAVAADLIRHEQIWLPRLAPSLPLPIPTPIFNGRPGCGYPWSWSLVSFLPGDAADLSGPSAEEADVLVEFLLALHAFSESGAPANPFRDVPLAEKVDVLGPRLDRLRAAGELSTELLQIWQLGVSAEIDLSPTWIHGDLHPKNVLTENGRLSAIIDWGDLTSGDPATDLASIWLLLESRNARERALERYGSSEKTRQRARAWALFFGAVFLASGLGDSSNDPNPRNIAIGRRAFERLVAGP